MRRSSACPREIELVGVLRQRRPLDRSGDDLEQHLAECTSCREVVALATALREGSRRMESEPGLPSASQVWWRARVRARLEAAQAAERPIAVAHYVAVAVVLGLVASAVGGRWVGLLASAVGHMSSGVAAGDVTGVVSVLGASPLGWALLMACVCVVVLMPIAALLVLSDE